MEIESPWLEWLIACAGAAAVILLWFVVFRTLNRRIEHPSSPAKHVMRALIAVLLVCSALSIVASLILSETQIFKVSGLIRTIALPFAYLCFFGVVVGSVLKPSGRQLLRRLPLWWYTFALLVILSTIVSVFVPRQPALIKNLLEGTTFTVGFLIVTAAGLAVADWNNFERKKFLSILAFFSFFSAITQSTITPFVAMVFPVAATLIFVSIQKRGKRMMAFALGSVLLAGGIIMTLVDRDSTAYQMQIVVSLGLILICIFKGVVRIGIIGGAFIACIYYLASEGYVSLLLGKAEGIQDVTLTHRAYEARVVISALEANALTWLLGLGPSATVDLSGAPDASTLISSGRDISAVDDVHLLSSWILLKFGFLGLAWLVYFIFKIGAISYKSLTRRTVDPFDFLLVALMLSGLMHSMSAATYLFSNPLLALSLGILVSRQNLLSSIERSAKINSGFQTT